MVADLPLQMFSSHKKSNYFQQESKESFHRRN